MVMAGHTMAVWSSLKTRRKAPQVEAVSLLRMLVGVVSLDLMC
jgi:MFS superfamily sulfate permease-like transporter